MFRNKSAILGAFVMLLSSGSLALASGPSQLDSQKFSLAKTVPGNTWLYTHWTYNPEAEFVSQHWAGVLEALRQVRLDQDLKQLILSELSSPEEQANFTKHWDRAWELIDQVKWCDLMSREGIYFQGPTAPGSTNGMPMPGFFPQHTMVLLAKSETVQENVQALVAILQELDSLCESVTLTNGEINQAKLWSLELSGAPLGLYLINQGDLIIFSSNSAGAQDVLARFNESPRDDALINLPKFQQAFAALPPAEDGVMYFDLANFLGLLKSGLSEIRESQLQAAQQSRNSTPGGAADSTIAQSQPSAPATEFSELDGLKIFIRLIDEFDFIDYLAMTSRTEGLQQYVDTVARLKPDAVSKPIVKIVTNNGQIADYLRYIPKEASSFWAWSGVDMSAINDWVLGFIKEEIPGGPDLLNQYANWQQEVNFHPAADLFGWLNGQMIAVTLPPAVMTPFTTADFVFMIKVKDGEQALTQINGWLAKAGPQMQILPAGDVQAEKFYTLSHPMLMMLGGGLKYGVQDNWLIIGSTAAALNKCLATAAGKNPNISENERFQKEGLKLDGPISSASFADMRNWHQEMAMSFGMMPMFSAMIPPQPEMQSTRTIFNMIGKLGPVFAKMDFFRSMSTATTFDGQQWVSQQVTTYREYTPPATTPTASPESAPATSDQSLDGL